ncbi:SAM-dependent methyltransferase TRM5/TYW2-type, partial [Schizophyllum fasciatum]
KNRAIRTVVNKLSTINAQFRFFDMELLAGDPDYEVEHHEANCVFRFDFKKVYWNSRLHTGQPPPPHPRRPPLTRPHPEHERLVALFEPTALVADVFAGVGPFAVPAAKKGCAVLANDLNPDSAAWLAKNIARNGVAALVRPSCEDGRAFIRAAVRRAREAPLPPYAPPVSRNKARARRGEGKGEGEGVGKGEGKGVGKGEGKGVGKDGAPAPASPTPSAPAPTPSAPAPTPSAPAPTPAPAPAPRAHIDHFVMNLPERALEFLDA